MRNDNKKALELLIEKSDKLKALSFIKSAKRANFNLSWNRDDNILRSKLTGPTDEQIDAFILTFRFFIQDNDRDDAHCSFRWLANNVFIDPDVSNHWKENFNKARNALNQFLDDTPKVKSVINDENPLTRRDIMYMIIYGDRSHKNPAKLEQFNKWMSVQILNEAQKMEFINILLILTKIIVYIAELSKAELEVKT